jgi:hypothetical protein
MQLSLVQGGFDYSELKIIKSMVGREEDGGGNCPSLKNLNTH